MGDERCREMCPMRPGVREAYLPEDAQCTKPQGHPGHEHTCAKGTWWGPPQARPKELVVTGARVNSVDEEGHVRLFCYSLGESWSFSAGFDGVKEWAARIGEYVTVRITLEKLPEKESRTRQVSLPNSKDST